MNFGPWHPLADAARHAPDAPGVFETRADDLVSFPRGRSAMVMYAASPPDVSLAAHLDTTTGATRLATAAAAGATLIRFARTADPATHLTRLLDRFVQRFGAPPPGNKPGA